MRQFWITAANQFGLVTLNHIVTARGMAQAVAVARSLTPPPQWGNICVTKPDGSDLPIRERWKAAFGEARAVGKGQNLALVLSFMQPTL